MTATLPLSPDTPLGRLAVTLPGASRVFHRHGLDFCCGGAESLREACRARGLDADALVREIEAEARPEELFERFDQRPLDELIDHLLVRFHEPHREELERLVAMALKVERVHAEKDTCPHGLARHLAALADELEQHMQKEEQVLFPLIRSGRGAMAAMPVQVMEAEHRDAGRALERTRELTDDLRPPAEACGTWRALYLGLDEFERDLMQHISLENNVLFPRALRG